MGKASCSEEGSWSIQPPAPPVEGPGPAARASCWAGLGRHPARAALLPCGVPSPPSPIVYALMIIVETPAASLARIALCGHGKAHSASVLLLPEVLRSTRQSPDGGTHDKSVGAARRNKERPGRVCRRPKRERGPDLSGQVKTATPSANAFVGYRRQRTPVFRYPGWLILDQKQLRQRPRRMSPRLTPQCYSSMCGASCRIES